jgi:hypothetical protein
MIMLGNAPLKSGFAALENFLWTASVAFPSWSGAIAIFYSLMVGGISALPFRFRSQV